MTSDSPPSTTPFPTPFLTPDSTGTGGSTSPDPTPAKKSRRQAFYPNVNSSNKPQKPFSRSAAKRDSVMALGSIEHLQHYFTKTGIAAKKNPLSKPYQGLVPAIGGPTHVRASPSISMDPALPPTPIVPTSHPTFPSHVKVYETNPDSLLRGVVEDLSAVAHVWQLNADASQDKPGSGIRQVPNLSTPIDILEALKTTTRAIRSIRNYLISLPDESAGTIRANFRPTSLGPSTIQTASTSLSSPARPDPLTLIRRSALEVLTVLRAVEENCRLPLTDEAYDTPSEAGSRGGSWIASPSNNSEDLPHDDASEGFEGPDFAGDTSITFMHVQGRSESIPVWEDEDDGSFVVGLVEEEEKEKREHWDERLDVKSGWLYRQDMTLAELEKERNVVSGYLDVVDEVLFDWKKDEMRVERGWERERRKAILREDKESLKTKLRRVSVIDGGGSLRPLSMFATAGGKRRISTGMLSMSSGMSLTEEPETMLDINEDEEGEESVDDDLPEWAQRSSFIDNDLGRAHALLSTFLPSHLISSLEPPTSRSDFLDCLSSGQLLCIAYNSCVRKSKHPWGYVSKDGIHDIVALEKAEREKATDGKSGDGGKKVWTFRRTDNLRLWAGALKIRYLLPIQVPTQTLSQGSGPGSSITPSKSSMRSSHRSTEPAVVFDAKVVARKDDGWEDMLETVLLQWVGKVVGERRNVVH